MQYTKKQLLEWIDNLFEPEAQFGIAEALSIPNIPMPKTEMIVKIIESLHAESNTTILRVMDLLKIDYNEFLVPYIAKAKKAQLVEAIIDGIGCSGEADMIEAMTDDMKC